MREILDKTYLEEKKKRRNGSLQISSNDEIELLAMLQMMMLHRNIAARA
jgi:hypothetical protein